MHYILHFKIGEEVTSYVCQSAAEAIDEMAGVMTDISDGTVEIRDFLGNVVDVNDILRQAESEARADA